MNCIVGVATVSFGLQSDVALLAHHVRHLVQENMNVVIQLLILVMTMKNVLLV